MGYDERLAERLRDTVSGRRGIEEKRMFGGIAFMVDGRMAFGIVDRDLMVRVGPDAHARALARPHVRPMDFTGKPLRGFVYVAPAGVASAKALAEWVEAGIAFARTAAPAKRRTATAKKRPSAAAARRKPGPRGGRGAARKRG